MKRFHAEQYQIIMASASHSQLVGIELWVTQKFIKPFGVLSSRLDLIIIIVYLN